MFGINDWWMFLSTALVINATPGADVLFVFTNYCKHGASSAIKSAIGLALGYLLYVLLTFVGLTLILTKYPLIANSIKICGGLYLIYLGITSLLDKSKSLQASENKDSSSTNLFIKGFLISALNPKVGLFFLSFLPQFIAGNNKIGIIILGTIFCIGATIFNLLYCLVFSHISKGNNYKIIMSLSGVILIALGIMVILR